MDKVTLDQGRWPLWHWGTFGGQSDTGTGLMAWVALEHVWWTRWLWNKFSPISIITPVLHTHLHERHG